MDNFEKEYIADKLFEATPILLTKAEIDKRVNDAINCLSDEYIPGTTARKPYLRYLDIEDPVDIVSLAAKTLRALKVSEEIVQDYAFEALSVGYTKAIMITARYVKVL